MGNKFSFPIFGRIFNGIMMLGLVLLLAGCGKDKEIVRYIYPPASVALIQPFADSIITVNPTFVWHKAADAVHYHLQVAKISDFVVLSIDTQTSDTSHVAVTNLIDNTYYWRVRYQDQNGVWGDWSDAEIRIFYKSTYVNYFSLLSQTLTNGVAQDVFVRGDSAYVADGQADLSIYDITNRANPRMMLNIDTGLSDDFALHVWVPPVTPAIDTFPFAYVSDRDGRIQLLNTRDPGSLLNATCGNNQNLQEIATVFDLDTIWVLAASSGFGRSKLSFYKVFYDPEYGGGPNSNSYIYEMVMPADANGVFTDSLYAYVACGSAGLKIIQIRDLYNPIQIATIPLAGIATSVFVKDTIAYVACDRAGLFVVGMSPDRLTNTVLHQVNTSGRTKDVQEVGNYAFLADASGGLKVVDVSVPDSAHVIASYPTPYAYGLFADSNYIYVCDRDLGLLIFANHISY